MKEHHCKAIESRRIDRCWEFCVTPNQCATNPERTQAHGNITIIDSCSCGMVRLGESNAGRRNYGPWHYPFKRGEEAGA